MQQVPKEVYERGARVTSDNNTYKKCMTIIKARIFTIEKILSNELSMPYLILRVESVYLQFRLLIEMLYLSTIVIRKKKYSSIWPRSEKEYQPYLIRKFLGKDLDEHFPYPYEKLMDQDGVITINFFPRPVSEDAVFNFFNKCHQYLHEPNPYKKAWEERESECNELLKEAAKMLSSLKILLARHYRVSELDDGEKVGLLCELGTEADQVFVGNPISDGKERA